MAAAQPWFLAWRRAHADQARPSQATRSVSPWAAPPRPRVPSPASGEVAGGGRAPPVPPRGPARWGVPLTSPYACGAVVGVPGPGRGLAGARSRRARALTRPPVAGVASPCAGARAWQGRVAPPPALWVWRWVVPRVQGCGWGRPPAVRSPSVSSPWRARPAPGGIARGGACGRSTLARTVPGAVSAALTQGPPGVDGACGPGGAPWGGGGGSLGGQSTPIGCQPPNKGLQPTPGSAVRVWQALPCTAPRCG